MKMHLEKYESCTDANLALKRQCQIQKQFQEDLEYKFLIYLYKVLKNLF